MSKWSDKFNALPKDIRYIGSMLEAELRIQHLKFELARLKKQYQQSCAEIKSHIARCENRLRTEDKDNG